MKGLMYVGSLVAMLVLAGCSTVGPDGFDQRYTDMLDERTASSVMMAEWSVSVRVTELREGPTVVALRYACGRKIRPIRVIVADESSAAPLLGSCVEVWVSRHPDMSDQGAMVLTGQGYLYYQGDLVDANNKQGLASKESFIQERLLYTARRVN